MSYYGKELTYGNFVADEFVGDGGTTTFTLSQNPSSINAVLVWVNDYIQFPVKYTIAGTQLIFVVAPANGLTILVRHLGNSLDVGQPPDLSIGTLQLQTAGVTYDKMASGVVLETGTISTFQQTTAPVGWTKQTSHNDKSLRVVSGAASSGGATAFTSVFGTNKNASSITLTAAQVPNHFHTGSFSGDLMDTHKHNNYGTNVAGAASGTDTRFHAINVGSGSGITVTGMENVSAGTPSGTVTVNSTTGGGNSHNHSLSLDVQYVDLILASKD